MLAIDSGPERPSLSVLLFDALSNKARSPLHLRRKMGGVEGDENQFT